MKTLIAVIALLVVTATVLSAQVKTIETTTTVDSAASGMTTSKSTSTKITEEILPPRNNMITINPLKFFLFYNISYYHALSDLVVLGGGLQMPTIKDLGGFGANVEVRLHPSGKRMRGFYIAPNFSFNLLSTRITSFDGSGPVETNNSATAVSIGVLLGWQWFPGDDFAMGLGIGVDKYFLSSSDTRGFYSIYDSFNGVAPAFRFDIGYAW